MSEVVFTRGGWFPKVVRDADELRLKLGAGANANHDPRTFSFPIAEAHLEVIRDDLARHLLLWCAILPLCDAAGTQGDLDEAAAVTLLDPILRGAPTEVDALFRDKSIHTTMLVAYGADIELLDRGEVVEALRSATETADHQRAQTYFANRQRAQRGVHLAPLDEAVLKYVGHYVHGSTRPGRHPDAVEPHLLREVMRIIETAERASAGMRIGRDPRKDKRSTDKQAWNRVSDAVDAAVRQAHPDLVDDALRSVSFLMCSEAADRTGDRLVEDDGEIDGAGDDAGASKTELTFIDDKGAEKKWRLGDPRSASAEFWEFVAERANADNEVFTIEDEELGEGIQLHFYSDSVARVTTAVEAKDGGEPQYRVEYALVDGMEGNRSVLRAFVRGGCAALDPHGPWMLDVDEFERARRQRDAAK